MDHRLLISILFSGIYAAFGLYNGLLYLVLRQRVFVYYAIMIFGFSAHNGMSLLGAKWDYLTNPGTVITAMITVLGLLLFGRSFMNVHKTNYPRLNIAFKLIAAVLISILLTQALNMLFVNDIDFSHQIAIPAAFMALVVVVFLLVSSIILFKKETSAKTYLYINSTLLLAAFAYTTLWFMRQNDSDMIVHFNLYIIHSFTTLQMILFSIFVGYKLKNSEKEKLAVQKNINKKLEEEVRKQTIHLTEARDEMECQKNELAKNNQLKNKILTLISHDLRNPLQQLSGLLKLLEDDLIDVKDTSKLSSSIRARLNNSLESMYRLLQWSYHQLDEIRVNKVSCELPDLLSELRRELQPLITEKDIDLKLNLETKKMVIDKDMLLVVLRNLTNNAIKFSPRKASIKIKSKPCSEGVEISIEDQGPGMNPDWYEKLISTGKPMVETNSDGITGTGFGLMIVKDFVEMNDGKLYCESSDQGTTFRLVFQS